MSEIKSVRSMLTVLFWVEIILLIVGVNFVGLLLLEGSGMVDAALWTLILSTLAATTPTILGLNKVESIIRRLDSMEAADKKRAESEHDAYVTSLEEQARFHRITSQLI